MHTADNRTPKIRVSGVSETSPVRSVLVKALAEPPSWWNTGVEIMNVPLQRADDVAGANGGQPADGQPDKPAAGQSAAGKPAGDGSPASNEPEYGLYAIVAGLVMLTCLDIAAIVVFRHNVNGAVAVIGAISAPVVAVVSAYFGMKVGTKSGSASAAAANKARAQAETEAKSLLGHMAPNEAKPVMRKLGIPVAD